MPAHELTCHSPTSKEPLLFSLTALALPPDSWETMHRQAFWSQLCLAHQSAMLCGTSEREAWRWLRRVRHKGLEEQEAKHTGGRAWWSRSAGARCSALQRQQAAVARERLTT